MSEALIAGIVLVLIVAGAIAAYFLVIKKDCEQGVWGPCDPVKKIQFRDTTIEPKYGGKECGVSEQACIPDIDCVQGSWGACDPSTKTQVRLTTTESSGTGKACGPLTQACVPDIDCVQSGWGACDPSTKTQVRLTTTESSGTGKVCGPSSQTCVPPKQYSWKDFVQYSGAGTDLPNQPIIGTLASCETACTLAGDCIGFSRGKNASDTDNAACYLKIAYPNKTMNDETWHTYSNI